MNIYRTLSLDEIIDELRGLPEGAIIRGIEVGVLHSDRGYYERGALSPSDTMQWDASTLADQLEGEKGKTIHGWKGGEYVVQGYLPVAVADYGDTGPYIAGFTPRSDGSYEPVGVYDW